MTKNVYQTCHNPDTFKYGVVKFGKNASNNKMLDFYVLFIAPVTKTSALFSWIHYINAFLYLYHKYGHSNFDKELLALFQLTKLLSLFYQNASLTRIYKQ